MRNETCIWISAALGFAVASCGQQRDARHPGTESQADERVSEVDSKVAVANGDGRQPQTDANTKDQPNRKSESSGAASEGSHLSGDQVTPHGRPDEPTSGGTPMVDQGGQSRTSSGIAEICEKIARRANEKCNKQVTGLYQSSCAHYLQKPGACDEPIRLALECQYKAVDDLFCAHGADHNCAQVNRELKICQRGTAPEEQTTTEDDRTLPEGWEQIEDKQLGFTVAMPPGAALDAESKRRTWKADVGGVTYYVAVIDPPTGKLNNQAFVRTVVSYVGGRCQLHLKLNGELEFKGTTVVQYHSACPDKTEWHGMLHFWNGKAVSTGYHAAPGMTGVREPFFYSFSISK